MATNYGLWVLLALPLVGLVEAALYWMIRS
jgi:hypothetical protein